MLENVIFITLGDKWYKKLGKSRLKKVIEVGGWFHGRHMA